MKGFKVCLDCDRGIKKGIAAHTFEDLKAKIAIKFEVMKTVEYHFRGIKIFIRLDSDFILTIILLLIAPI